jgi:hypothetical protein
MAEESTYPVVTSLLSSHRIRLILNALGGPTGTGSISAADFLSSQIVQDMIDTWTDNHILAGTGVTLDRTTDPHSLTISASGGSGGYTDAAAIAAVGGALTPVATHLQKSVVGNVINLDLAQEVLDRLTALEQPSLIQTKDTVSASGTNYMSFPGTTGNYISTPSHAAYNSINDLCIVVRFQKPATNPGTDSTIVARYNSLPGAAQFRFLQVNAGANAGCLRLVSTVDGTSQSIPTTTVALPYDGQYIWVKVRRRASDGDTGFWTAPDTGSNSTIPTTWTALGALNRSSTAGTPYNNAGALSVPLSIGAYNVGALFPFTGQIGRVIVYSGLDEVTGTIVADANAGDYTSGTTWTGPLSRVWTISGTASVVLGGTTLISNTTSEFSLGETDAFPTVPVGVHYSLLWSTEATLVNTSGASVNYTPKLKIGGVDLFTWPAPIAISSAAGSVYNLGCSVKVSVNSSDGTSQIARAQLIINNAVTGTDLGSISMASNLTNMSANRAMSGILTIATIPQMQLRMTMSAAAATVAARPLRTQLFLAAA